MSVIQIQRRNIFFSKFPSINQKHNKKWNKRNLKLVPSEINFFLPQFVIRDTIDARLKISLTFTDSILVAGGRMFKRLSKSRRHSADDVALSLSSPTTLDEPPGTSTPRDNCQSISPAALLRVSRTKYTRRSCGDASAMQALLATSKQEQEQDVAEADYQMVTAVPAFIVEHEPEKQRGECI